MCTMGGVTLRPHPSRGAETAERHEARAARLIPSGRSLYAVAILFATAVTAAVVLALSGSLGSRLNLPAAIVVHPMNAAASTSSSGHGSAAPATGLPTATIVRSRPTVIEGSETKSELAASTGATSTPGATGTTPGSGSGGGNGAGSGAGSTTTSQPEGSNGGGGIPGSTTSTTTPPDSTTTTDDGSTTTSTTSPGGGGTTTTSTEPGDDGGNSGAGDTGEGATGTTGTTGSDQKDHRRTA